MKVLIIQHVEFECPGEIRSWAIDQLADITSYRPYLGDPEPSGIDFDFVAIMGGPMAVYESSKFPWLATEIAYLRRLIENDVKMLGVCLGSQLLAHCMGARVYPGPVPEVGWFSVEPLPEFSGSLLDQREATLQKILHWHGDTFDIPNGARSLVRSQHYQNQAFQYERQILGLQFHLEMTRAGLKSISDHCGSEIVPGPSAQSPEQILDRASWLVQSQHYLRSVLDHWLLPAT